MEDEQVEAMYFQRANFIICLKYRGSKTMTTASLCSVEIPEK